MKPYNQVVDAGVAGNASKELLLARLISVELRHPVYITEASAKRLGDLVVPSGGPEMVKTIRDTTEACVRVCFSDAGRGQALAAWKTLCGKKHAAQIDSAGPEFTLCARKARLMDELGLATATVAKEAPTDTKVRYTLALTPAGLQLLEG